MFQAHIQSGQTAVHLRGDMDAYNLEALQGFAHKAHRDAGPVHLKLCIDPCDRDAFEQQSNRWLRHLVASGTVVEVVVNAK